MALSSETRRSPRYIGTGSETIFPFAFKLLKPTDLEVRVALSGQVETTLEESAYTVVLNESQDNNPGGTVTLKAPLAKDAALVIISDTPYLQPTTYTNRGGFYPEQLNTNLDRLTILTQQLKEHLDRTITVPPTSPTSPQELFYQLLNAAKEALESAQSAEEALAACEQIRQLIEQYSWDIPHIVDSLRDVENYPYDGLFAVAGFGNAGGNGQNISNRYVKAEGSTELRTLGERFADVVNVRDYGAVGDGVTDDTAAIQAALLAVKEGGKVLIPGGMYVVSQKILLRKSLHISGDGATIKCSLPLDSTDAVFDFQFKNRIIDTALTANVSKGQTSLSVANTIGVSEGDYVVLSSNEYFSGVEGVSGFEIENKGELNQINSFSGNTIYLAIPAQDSYDNENHPVTVRVVRHTEDISVEGVSFVGTGGGASHTDENPKGCRAIHFIHCSRVRITNCRFTDFPRYAIQVTNCADVIVSNNDFVGVDPFDESNFSIERSKWFTGCLFQGGVGLTFTGNTGRYLRRHLDIDNQDTGCVARGITITSNTAISCRNVVGTHGCQGVVICGNVGIGCSSGIAFRGKDCVISGNDLGTVSGDYAILLGSYLGTYQNYDSEQSPSVGDVVVSNNKCNGSKYGIFITIDAKSVLLDGNNFSVKEHGVNVYSRRIDELQVSNNHFLSGGSYGSYGIITRNISGQIISISNISITSNLISNFYRCIVLCGSSVENPMNNITITNNSLYGTFQGVRLGNDSTANNSLGYFGSYCVISGNTIQAETSISIARTRFIKQPVIFANADSNSSRVIDSSLNASIPDSGTFEVGQIILDSAPTTYLGKVCISAGTIGKMSNVTASTTAGSAVITVSTVSGELIEGQYISIVDDVSRAKILSINRGSKTITLSKNVTNTYSSKTIKYEPPVFANFGEISPIE